MNEVNELQKTVISNDYCIGCGACASLKNSPFKIKLNEYGNYIAYLDKNNKESISGILGVCPFSNQSKDEDQLSQLYLSGAPNTHPLIGRYYNCYAGYVKKYPYRENGSSGGIGKWIGYKLLSENLVDYYVHVTSRKRNNSYNALFEYNIIDNSELISSGSKSSYYPVTLEMVLNKIRTTEGRFAITGVPCFIKAIRLLSENNPDIKSKITFTIGLFCGGMKSANHAKMIAWQLGITPEYLDGIDFRVKSKDGPATHKIYKVWSDRKGITKSELSHNLFGTGWNGYFTPKACFYCDDVVAETADISIGDAWLPKYVIDSNGTNIIIVRNPLIREILQKSENSKEIYIEEITSDEVAQSQAGGFRQRRDALSYRIKKKETNNEWYPLKRVKSDDFILSKKRKMIYSLREDIATQSHIRFLEAYTNGNFNYFLRKMKLLEYKYIRVNIGYIMFYRFLLSKIKTRFFKLIRF